MRLTDIQQMGRFAPIIVAFRSALAFENKKQRALLRGALCLMARYSCRKRQMPMVKNIAAKPNKTPASGRMPITP